MRTTHTIAAAIILAGLTSAAAADYTQNFDSMGTTGLTPPPGWSVWYLPGSGASLVIPTSAEMAGANAGVDQLMVWNQTDTQDAWSQQGANMGSTATDPNRLLGTSPTGTRGTILQLSLNNSTAGAATDISVAYDMKCMADGVLKSGFPPDSTDELPGYSFYYLDGSVWTHLASLDLNNSTVNSVGHASATFHLTTPVPSGGNLELRWFDDNADAFSPDTMYAIDNVTINIPEPGTLSLLAVGALALISRRRKA